MPSPTAGRRVRMLIVLIIVGLVPVPAGAIGDSSR